LSKNYRVRFVEWLAEIWWEKNWVKRLLTWSDLRLIRTQRLYLHWGPNKAHKEALLSASKRRLRYLRGMGCVLMVLFLLGLGWWHSPWGQMWLAERNLLRLRAKVFEPFYVEQIVAADAANSAAPPKQT
jgi:hypothetical protein